MEQLLCYKTLPIWHKDTVPDAFKQQHNTQPGTWAQLNIRQGQLTFELLTESGEVSESHQFDVTRQPPMIAPQQWHRIASTSDDIECQLSFFCAPEEYYLKKQYDLSKTHSEVVAAMPHLRIGKALDLGCGHGRNSLYLHLQGFDVTGYDRNGESIAYLQQLIADEQLSGIRASQQDLTELQIQGAFDFILSTVVLMFLPPATVPGLIAQMQQHTLPGGVNLIVSAMDTEDFPCTVGFPFTFKANELLNYYAGWDIIKYNENVGELHKRDEQGNYIKLRFATLLARKPQE
ncbi:SAM-dependent methyltransferase TehB [Shewanella dokdonensis]|uniref:SAM-dependent methyltransferase TehB n=1 Tax=Shewanella dokdonensis TaxID=712036 RepID=UPI00200E8B41|nr:SAM-dependent methyltransferase TehB [Shewanella dokdonensis]MCL1074857.1 SAM-dependent methyltransferase TehB [Shewanella dokdonensis]